MAYPTKNQGYNKAQTAATSSAPVKKVEETKQEGTAVKPMGTLYMQEEGAQEKTKLTGLFKETSKAGQVYYRGKGTDGTKFIVFIN